MTGTCALRKSTGRHDRLVSKRGLAAMARHLPRFAADYDKWLQRAEAGFKQHQDSSHFPEKVVIDPDEFMEWSQVHGREVNGQARSAYAASIIAAQDRPSH